MLEVPPSPVPSISISFAPPQLLPVDSKSRFSITVPREPDSPRPQHLLPPSPLSLHHDRLSPLSPPSPLGNKGLERQRFEALLKASKERSSMFGVKKPVELRKEVAMKAQKVKQFERRALFLSKLIAPPSPSAADMPVTPPDSPAIFHFSLPSPGLTSPLELFEEYAKHPEMYESKVTIEQVDFRLTAEAPGQAQVSPTKNAVTIKRVPSLEQISRRLSRSSAVARSSPGGNVSSAGSRLPTFLRSRAADPLRPAEPSPAVGKPAPVAAPKKNRLALPVLSLPVPEKKSGVAVRTPTPTVTKSANSLPFPPSPMLTPVKLEVKTTICPPTKSKPSPTEFTTENLAGFDNTQTFVTKPTAAFKVSDKPNVSQRVQVSRDLITKLSRRTSGLPGAAACGIRARDDTHTPASSTEDKMRRRYTSPAEMSPGQRGFRHPVLDKPGGF